MDFFLFLNLLGNYGVVLFNRFLSSNTKPVNCASLNNTKERTNAVAASAQIGLFFLNIVLHNAVMSVVVGGVFDVNGVSGVTIFTLQKVVFSCQFLVVNITLSLRDGAEYSRRSWSGPK